MLWHNICEITTILQNTFTQQLHNMSIQKNMSGQNENNNPFCQYRK